MLTPDRLTEMMARAGRLSMIALSTPVDAEHVARLAAEASAAASDIAELVADRSELLASMLRLSMALSDAPSSTGHNHLGLSGCICCQRQAPDEWLDTDDSWHRPDCTWAAARREARELLAKETTHADA